MKSVEKLFGLYNLAVTENELDEIIEGLKMLEAAMDTISCIDGTSDHDTGSPLMVRKKAAALKNYVDKAKAAENAKAVYKNLTGLKKIFSDSMDVEADCDLPF